MTIYRARILLSNLYTDPGDFITRDQYYLMHKVLHGLPSTHRDLVTRWVELKSKKVWYGTAHPKF